MTQPMPAHAAVWFEIPVTDIARSRAFYGAVLQSDLSLNEDGPNPMAIFAARDDSSVSGHLYPGKPAAAGPARLSIWLSPHPSRQRWSASPLMAAR